MQILITGGLGFIGGRLAKYLSEAGHKIVIGSRNSLRTTVLSQTKVKKIEWDDDIALERICMGMDIVIHAAGMNAQDCASNPKAALEFNGGVTTRFVKAASKAGVWRFIYLSTAHVYSNPLVGVITEESSPINVHPYASSHLVGDLAVNLANKHGMTQGFVFRLSNGFGAPMYDDVNCWMLLINDLCKQAVLTHKMILKSSGQQERDFIGINQICLAIEKIAIEAEDSKQSKLYNLGSGASQSVISMAQLIQERCSVVLGFKPTISCKEEDTDTSFSEEKLDYRIDKITAVGVKFKNEEKVKEIDDLLRFCQSSFIINNNLNP